MNPIGRGLDLAEKALFGVSAVVTLVMMVLISADAFCRYAFNMPILGVVEVTQDFLMEALVFLTLSYVYKCGAHVRVTLFTRHFPKGMLRPLEAFGHVASLVFAILITVGGWELFVKGIRFDSFSMGVLQYPMAPSYAIVPLGGLVLCLRILYMLFFPEAPETEDEAPAVEASSVPGKKGR